MELANRALGDPVAGLRALLLGWRLALLGLGDLGVGLSLLGGVGGGLGGWVGAAHGLVFVLGGRLVVGLGSTVRGGLLAGFGDLGWLGLTFDGSGGRCAALGVALGAALDGQGLRIGELDVDVLLVDAGEFAVQLVRILTLLDVKAGLEGADSLVEGGTEAAAHGVVGVVVEKAEERCELAREWGRAWAEGSEERHVSGWCDLLRDSVVDRKSGVDADSLHRSAGGRCCCCSLMMRDSGWSVETDYIVSCMLVWKVLEYRACPSGSC